jgi:hypothetical protein
MPKAPKRFQTKVVELSVVHQFQNPALDREFTLHLIF